MKKPVSFYQSFKSSSQILSKLLLTLSICSFILSACDNQKESSIKLQKESHQDKTSEFIQQIVTESEKQKKREKTFVDGGKQDLDHILKKIEKKIQQKDYPKETKNYELIQDKKPKMAVLLNRLHKNISYRPAIPILIELFHLNDLYPDQKIFTLKYLGRFATDKKVRSLLLQQLTIAKYDDTKMVAYTAIITEFKSEKEKVKFAKSNLAKMQLWVGNYFELALNSEDRKEIELIKVHLQQTLKEKCKADDFECKSFIDRANEKLKIHNLQPK